MKKTTCRRILPYCCVWLASFSISEELRAADPAPSGTNSALMNFLTQDYLFGTWGGGRKWLSDHGLDLEFVYFGALPVNMSGGIKTGSVLEGALLMTADLDSKKLVGYDGGTLHAGGLWIHNGDPFSGKYVGDLNVVSLLDFPDMWRLWELYYQQKLLDGKFTLKIGELAVDRDFIVPEYYTSIASINFLNQTFFYPTMAFNVWDIAGFPKGNHGLASTPYGAPGVVLRAEPVDQIYLQAGAYDGNPDLIDAGGRVNLNKEEGALIYFEAGYGVNKRKEDEGPPGNYKIGGYYHTDDFFDNRSVFNAFLGLGAPTTHSGNYGVYFLADQMLYQELGKEDPANQGLTGFFRVGWAPEDRNLASLGIDGGLMYKGLIPTRDWDTFGVAASYMEISDDISKGQRLVNSFAPGTFSVADYEFVVETSYRAQLTAWWTLQPDFQWVKHPGGSSAHSDAFVFILMTSLRF